MTDVETNLPMEEENEEEVRCFNSLCDNDNVFMLQEDMAEMIELKMQNVVATVNLQIPLDLVSDCSNF